MADLSSYINIAANTVTTANLSASGSVTSNSVLSTTGNVTGNYIFGDGSQLTNITVSGSSPVSTTGNVSAGNLTTTGTVSATNIGNIASINLDGNASTVLYGNGVFAAVAGGGTYSDANVNTLLAAWGSNTISTTGNITSGYLFGNGSQLTGIAASYGNSNVTTLLASFGSNTVSTSGNVTAGYVVGNGSTLSAITGANVTGTVANATYATSAGSATTATSATTAATVTTAAQPNITSVGILSSASVSGNITGGNIRTAGLVSATGNVTAGGLTINGTGVVTGNLQVQGTLTYNNLTNITTPNLVFGLANTSTGISANGAGFVAGNTSEASFLYNYSAQAWNSNIGISAVGNIAGNYIIGNGSQLTGVTAYTNANVSTFLAAFGSNTISTTGNITGGNIDLSYMGGAAKGNVTGGNISMSGNITGGNVATGGLVSATGSITTGSSVSAVGTVTGANLATGGTVSATANITGGNVATGGIVSSTGNITGGNLRTGGSVSATGSLTGGNIFTAGNVSATGNTTSGNILASATISTGGNIFAGAGITAVGTIAGSNLNITGLISATGNTTAGNVLTAGQVSATGNIYGGNVINSGISSVTGNITGGNILTAGQASATGNITTANYFVGNLVGTTASMTGNVYAGNVIVNGQPTTYGVVNPDYIQAEKSANQTSVGINTDVTFNVTSTSSGISQTNGVFTLTAGKTYLLQADLCISNFSANTAYTWWSWVDSTTNAQLDTSNGSALATGSSGVAIPATWVGTNDQYAGTARLIYTPATNQTVKLRITDASGTCSILAIASKATITQINPTIAVQATATGTVAKNYAKYTRTASQSVSANSVIVCNVAESSSGTAVSVNTSTGQVTLTAGTYRLRGTAGTTAGSVAASLMGYGWYNETTSAWVGEGAGWVSPASLNYNVSTSGTAEYVITVASTTVVSLRVIAVTGVTSIGGNQSDFAGTYANPWIDIEQIGSTFALNALATMSVTGNITTTGNVSATGNVTAANFFGNGNTLSNVATTFQSTWTVPTGNSTQSFTVSPSNTYYMWVDCNIPNGILTWNATATLTNTNVPVVGAQYAWVYNGGGTPVDFTSIPNQFVGTSNTIVRSSTAPSATTNKFDFGINNTSGGNVTVRYGYTKIS
jgi:hypothetical protein